MLEKEILNNVENLQGRLFFCNVELQKTIKPTSLIITEVIFTSERSYFLQFLSYTDLYNNN